MRRYPLINFKKIIDKRKENLKYMNKTELVAKTQENIDIEVSKKDLTTIIDGVIKTIQDAVVSGERVQLVGFGTFETTTRAAREGRNPATGQAISIPESKAPRFKAGKAFKDAVKNA